MAFKVLKHVAAKHAPFSSQDAAAFHALLQSCSPGGVLDRKLLLHNLHTWVVPSTGDTLEDFLLLNDPAEARRRYHQIRVTKAIAGLLAEYISNKKKGTKKLIRAYHNSTVGVGVQSKSGYVHISKIAGHSHLEDQLLARAGMISLLWQGVYQQLAELKKIAHQP
jgi:hypothetical protein